MEKSIGLLTDCPKNPLIELAKMKTLEVAAACFGSAMPVRMIMGDNQIPPPMPTSPATMPKIAPVGIPINNIIFCLLSHTLDPLDFIYCNFSNLPLIPERIRTDDAANSDKTNIRARYC